MRQAYVSRTIGATVYVALIARLTNPPPSTWIRKPTTGYAQRLLNGPTTAKGVQRLHALPRRLQAICTPSIGVQPCQTGVQSLHACLEGVQSLHALRTGVQALHACRLTSNCAAHKPATKFHHPDPQANDRPRPTDTHQTQPSR
ncbi:hypothetical protein PCASD_21168 [Puccinia coronata f. sp. avenae]|uniref:Uncharacterized protein n=1 Tax=Puccinia coronata f. sp. avenae TaxID=200324 RepID=A0A2N5TQ43_9BASI|nr:hypothetical protein PCASD_21168 [Puccinia coronata f. sp. avenae]